MKSNAPVLLLEDDKVDQLSLKRAMLQCGITNSLFIAGNGEEALQLLDDADEVPCLIFLDINMPKMDGLEFLANIKKDPVLKKIPVIVFTTSNRDHERNKAYEIGISAYIVKPVDYRELVNILKVVFEFWNVSEFPSLESHPV
jgi:CheY-like chemotaxis protein